MSMRFKWDMFFTSFLPLWISIVVSDIWTIVCKFLKYKKGLVEACIITLSKAKIEIFSVLLLFIYIIISIHHINSVIRKEKRSINKRQGTIKKAKRENKLTTEFFLAFTLPIFVFDFSSLRSIVLFLIYFGTLSFLCIRNNNIYTNIFLEMKGYRIYDCDIECAIMNETKIFADSLVISKKNLTQTLPQKIDYFDFENYIYIEIGD